MEKFDYASIKAHDIKTRDFSILATLFIEIALVVVGVLGLTIWNEHFLSALCLINALVLPFVLPRNLVLCFDFGFYGKTKTSERLPFIKHYSILAIIELCIFGASFPFLSRVYFVLVAISLPVILGLMMLLVMERNTYSQIHKFLDMDRQLSENPEDVE